MLQRRLRKGLVGLLAACCFVGAGTVRAEKATDPCALSAQLRSQLVESSRHTALEYDASLTGSEVMARASRDAEALGLPLVKTLAVGRVAIVEGSRAEVARRLQAAERIPVARLIPVYFAKGNPSPDSMLVLTSRLLVSFDPSASEAAKRAWLTAQGLQLVRETGQGRSLVESGRQADLSMLDYAAELQSSSPLLAEASFEYLMTIEQTSSDSIVLNDDFFRYQWPLFNSGDNTNADLGKIDEDLDAPRAWMFNQRNARDSAGLYGKGTFGDPSLVVAVFDSGTEVAHEDLAQNIDPRIGSDYVDSGAPTPPLSVIGAHGTAIAGLILATANDKGVVGVAPGVKLFTTRVIGPDNSTTNLSIRLGIEETVLQDIDINVHPYTLPVDNTAGLASDVEGALRQAFESGRDALGLPNIAATGNFYSQVEYPAASKYCISVSSVSSEGGRTLSANWGGVGADIVGPSFALTDFEGYSAQSGTGVVTTDLSANPGLALQDVGTPGNESGNYAPVGYVQGFTNTALANTVGFFGTSVSVAHMAGTLALMMSDNRYDELPPLFDPGNAAPQYDRATRRARAPRFGDNLLSQLTAHADLPSGDFETGGELESLAGFSERPNVESLTYIDQYNEFLGFGRPNPSRFTAVNKDTSAGAASGVATADSFYTSFLQNADDGSLLNVYSVVFAEEAGGGASLDPVRAAELGKGWSTEDGISTVLVENGPTYQISPFLEGVKTLYFEDGTSLFTGRYFYVWADSMTTGTPEAAALETLGDNLRYNPQGRYHRNLDTKLVSPAIVPPEGMGGQPMLLTMQLAHAIGVENASRGATVTKEVDGLFIEMRIQHSNGSTETRTLGRITGDSSNGRKNRLTGSTIVQIGSPGRAEPQWLGGVIEYRPYVTDEQMIIRTYRFLVPPVASDESFQLVVRLRSGSSFLPEYKYDATTGAPTQIYNSRWDDKGFMLYSAKVNMLQATAYDYLTKSNFGLTLDSRRPTWSASMNDVFFVQDIGSADGRSLSVIEARPQYVNKSGSAFLQQPVQKLVQSSERITGLKGHPSLEVMAMTTDDGEAQGLYVVTTDGVNQKRLVNPQSSAGARDPSWASNGKQLIYSGPSYIRIASILSDLTAVGDPLVNVETVLSSDTTDLEDFHSPLLDYAGGNVIFTARRKGSATDTSLQLYVANRNGRVFDYSNYSDCDQGPSRPAGSPFLYGWDNIDIFDLDLSVADPAISAGRLIFAANASSAPVPPPNCSVDLTSPVTFTPAVPSSAAYIYTIENFNNVINNNDAPVYTKVSLQSPDVNYTVSARYPRISPNRRELLYTGFNAPVSQDSETNGFTVRQAITTDGRIDPVNVIVPIPPTPTPPPTSRPPVVIDGQVAYTAQNIFLNSQEGWEFRTGGSDLDAPQFTFVQTGGGSLRLQARGSLNTFGYVESPRGSIQSREGALHLYRAYIRATNSVASQSAGIRLRVNSTNLESAFTSETNSRGDLKLSPTSSATKHYDLLFRPPVGIFNAANGRQNYSASVDLLNFFADDDPYAGIEVEKIELYRLDEAGRYFNLWSFIAGGTGTISLNAVANGADGEMSLGLRTCCSDNTTEVACVAGSSASGAALTSVAIEAGKIYTVVVASPFAQNVELLWSSTVDLSGSEPNSCNVLASGCAISVPISGRDGSNGQQSVFLGRGQAIDAPSCATVENRTVITRLDKVFAADFSDPSTRARWRTGPDPTSVPYQNPEFTQVDNSLALRVVNPANTFGYWSAAGSAIPAGTVVASDDAPYVIYRAQFLIANPYENDPLKVPTIRARLATNDFQRIVTNSLQSVREGTTVPVAAKPQNFEVYMVLEQIPSGFTSFVAGFDVLSFSSGRAVTAQPIELKKLQIERIYIPSYPLPK